MELRLDIAIDNYTGKNNGTMQAQRNTIQQYAMQYNYKCS